MNHSSRRTHLSFLQQIMKQKRRLQDTSWVNLDKKGGDVKTVRGRMFAMTYLVIIEMAAVIGNSSGSRGVLSCSLSHSAVSHTLDGCLCPLQAA